MITGKFGLMIAAACMTFGATAAHADTFGTMRAIPGMKLSTTEMKAVEGKQHVYLLVESLGVELPAQGEAATRAAAPTPESGMFRRSPSRDAAAFVNALGAPATPTRL